MNERPAEETPGDEDPFAEIEAEQGPRQDGTTQAHRVLPAPVEEETRRRTSSPRYRRQISTASRYRERDVPAGQDPDPSTVDGYRREPGSADHYRRASSTDEGYRREPSTAMGYQRQPSTASRYRRQSSQTSGRTSKHYARKLTDETHSRIGGYRLLDKLGRGGMSVVYRSLQIATGRQVALKVVELEMMTQEGLAEQIFREASALAQISHPNVIGCFGFGEDRGRMYMALELITGGDSTGLVKRHGRLEEGRIIDIALQCVEGFRAIHNAGFIHRDIKPSNIFLTEDGTVKIADLGLAWDGSQLDRDSRVATMGTPSYMSPEQVSADQELDFRSDIYSLGASCYFYATGRPPHSGRDVWAVLDAVVNEPCPDVREINGTISDDLAAIIATMTAKAREKRYASLDALAEDLRAVRAGGSAINCEHVSKPTVSVRTAARIMREHGRRRPSRWVLPVGVLVAMVMLGLGWVVLRNPDASPAPAPAPDRAVPVQTIDLLAAPDITWVSSGPVGLLQEGRLIHCAGGMLRSDDNDALIAGIVASDAFSLELVIRPERLDQLGPARIVGSSLGTGLRNLTLGQQGGALELRVRTTATSANGLRPHLITQAGVLTGGRQHIIVVRGEGMHRIWVDGELVAEQAVGGDCSNWDDSYPLLIGNELQGGFPWLGMLSRLRISNSAWDAAGVQQRYQEWRSTAGQ